MREDRFPEPDGAVVIGDGVRIDLARREVRRGDRVLRMSRQSYQLLKYLADCADRVVAIDELVANVWHGHGTPATVRQEMHVLRRALDESARGSAIESVRGAGYRVRRAGRGGRVDPGVARCLAAGTRLRASGAEPELRKAVVWFSRATAIDAHCDAAWLGLAQCRLMLGIAGHDDPAVAAEAIGAALRRTAPSIAARIVALDADFFLRGQLRAREYAAVRDDDPANPDAHVAFAWASVHLGDTRAAADAARAAVALAPASLDVHHEYGMIMYYVGALGEAVAELELVAAMDPARSITVASLAMVLLAQGKTAQAADAIRFVSTDDCAIQASMAVVAASAGDRAKAHRCADAVLGRAPAYVSPYHAAKCYYALGRTADYTQAIAAASGTPNGRLLRFERWMA